jgi:outer membrane lipoprotein LolB
MRVSRGLCAAALGVALASCASVAPPPPRLAPAATDAAFAVDGRLSARRGREALAVSFAWTHAPPKDDFVVSTPLGQTVAELAGDASIPRVEMRGADGRRDAAADWTTLTERALGISLPVDGLGPWAQGVPRAGTAHAVERDAVGRADVLRQDGCEIVYAYPDTSTLRPSGLRIACGELEMRVVIDRWRLH